MKDKQIGYRNDSLPYGRDDKKIHIMYLSNVEIVEGLENIEGQENSVIVYETSIENQHNTQIACNSTNISIDKPIHAKTISVKKLGSLGSGGYQNSLYITPYESLAQLKKDKAELEKFDTFRSTNNYKVKVIDTLKGILEVSIIEGGLYPILKKTLVEVTSKTLEKIIDAKCKFMCAITIDKQKGVVKFGNPYLDEGHVLKDINDSCHKEIATQTDVYNVIGLNDEYNQAVNARLSVLEGAIAKEFEVCTLGAIEY